MTGAARPRRGRRCFALRLFGSVGLALMACATPEGGGDGVAERGGAEGPSAAETPAGPGVKVWFAARATPCERVVAALGELAGQPGVVTPEEVRVAATGPWCAVAGGERRGVRADSWAQNVSSVLGVPAVAFYVADGSWSAAVFDEGQPLSALESHYGEAVVVGDAARAAAALGIAAGELAGARAQARRPEAHVELAGRIGFTYPSEREAWVAVRAPDKGGGDEVEAAAAAPEVEAGSWVVMPPHGVMLVKSVEERGGEAEGEAQTWTYVVVAGARQLRVPVAAARKLGMRPVASAAVAEAALASLGESVEVHAPREYLEGRSWRWLDALKAGDLAGIARAHRELCTIQRTRRLYAIEEGLLGTVEAWLVDELAVARGTQPDEVREAVRRACE